MARYTDASCRLCRREGTKLFIKGQRCHTDKCAFSRRQSSPGQHGQQRKKVSEYGIQLREKQKAKRIYGVLERQFRKYFDIAANKKGITGDNLLQLLEIRLDNVVFRLGLATSRKEARQLVRHGHFNINGKKVNIPSYLVRVNEEISVTDKFKKSTKLELIDSIAGGRVVPEWLDYSQDTYSGRIVALPTREDSNDIEIKDHLIVELYSK
ncbi:MAG: 30S ribosomal protein S4 [Clostridiales bacterium]